jgi:hypothetical protein
MYVLCAPHLEIGGWHNNGQVLRVGSQKLLAAHKGNTWLVIGATVPFTETSCGYVGVNDGWTDLADNYRLDWQYDAALDGNIALTGGFDLSRGTKFTVGLAFGTKEHCTWRSTRIPIRSNSSFIPGRPANKRRSWLPPSERSKPRAGPIGKVGACPPL